MPIPTSLPIIDRADILSAAQISFCNSPIHLRIQNAAQDSTSQSAIVYLWVWNGAQNRALAAPNVTLYKTKVSASDTYINIQIDDQIKSFLIAPPNAPNTSQPTISYNQLSSPAMTGQGVFWQIKIEVTSTTGTEMINGITNFATLGWLWNHEQNLNNVRDVDLEDLQFKDRWYGTNIHDYFNLSFNFSLTVATATTGNMIFYDAFTPPANRKRCSRDPYLILFINKLGLWDTFTPHGKVVTQNKIEREISNISYRDPSRIDNTYQHSRTQNSIDVLQSYTINTGSLLDEMVDVVEELVVVLGVVVVLVEDVVVVEDVPTARVKVPELPA